jgi:hypothetical protein
MAKFAVYPRDGYGKALGAPVYIEARDFLKAEAAGRRILRAFGQRGRFKAEATEWDPGSDLSLRALGFVRPLRGSDDD